MSPLELRTIIKGLSADGHWHKYLEKALEEGVGFNNAWYSSQKEHWLGWLAEYDGPGAYNRVTQAGRDAKFIYNHIQCAPMLLWLAEAIEIDEVLLEQAQRAVIAAPKNNASQCAALRRCISWQKIEIALLDRQIPKISRFRPLLDRWLRWRPHS